MLGCIVKPKMMLYCEAENDAVYSACRAHQHIEAEFGEKHTQVQFADMRLSYPPTQMSIKSSVL